MLYPNAKYPFIQKKGIIIINMTQQGRKVTRRMVNIIVDFQFIAPVSR